MIIAIDGPAGAGKSTVARYLANELGFVYLDTGAIYRALTLKALNNNMDFQDEPGLAQMSKNTKLDISNNKDGTIRILMDGEDVSEEIRLPIVNQHVSRVARIKQVREAILKLQQHTGSMNNSVVDGRDIATVVFPNANKKFYLDAEFNVRVSRRHKELLLTGKEISLEEVGLDLKNRDHIDSTRSCAPLKRAEDAIYIDTTKMTIREVIDKLLKEITEQENRLRR